MNRINQLEKNNIHNLIKNNKLILKSQKRFKSEKHNVFTEEVKNQC